MRSSRWAWLLVLGTSLAEHAAAAQDPAADDELAGPRATAAPDGGTGAGADSESDALSDHDIASRLAERWRWRIFDRGEGVSPGRVACAFQDADDFIYAATDRGLCRYDLHHWEVVENAEPFTGGEVERIVEALGVIYCATPHVLWALEGGAKLRRVHPGAGGAGGRLHLAAGAAGAVYLIDEALLGHFRVQGTLEPVDSVPLPPPPYHDYAIDASGHHWLATGLGLYHRDLARRRWIEVPARDLPVPGGLCVRLFSVAPSPALRPRPGDGAPARELWALFQSSGSADRWRLARLEASSWHDPGLPPLPSPVDGLVRARPGRGFVTCEDGRLYSLSSAEGSAMRLDPAPRLGIGSVKVHGVIADSGGRIWLRLAAGGLVCVDLDSERWSRLAGLGGPPYPRVLSLLETRAGDLWAGTESGLLHWRRLAGERPRWSAVEVGPADRPLRDITALAEEANGGGAPARIWVGSERFNGVYSITPPAGDEDEDEVAHDARGAGGAWGHVALVEPVHRIVRDSRDELWFLPGAEPQHQEPRVYRLSALTGFKHRPVRIASRVAGFAPTALAVNDLERGRGDVFWLATDDGLLESRLEGDELGVERRLTERDGLASSRVWAVEEGPDGSIWLCYPSSGRGVTRLAGGALSFYDVGDGLAGPEVWAIARSGQNVWFGTDAGLSRFDGEAWYGFPVEAEDPHSSRVLSLLPLAPAAGEPRLAIGTAERGLVVLTSDDSRRPRIRKSEFPASAREGQSIAFRWRARDFKNETPPEDLAYRYRVDGGPWRPVRGADGVELDGLGVGRHLFELEVRDLDGNRNRRHEEGEHVFEVLPRSSRWPLAAGVSAILLALAAAFHRSRSRRAERRRILDRYGSVYRAWPGAVLVLDDSLRVLDYNGAAPDLLGLGAGEAREVIGRPAKMIPAAAQLGLLDLARQALAGRPGRTRIVLPRSDDDRSGDGARADAAAPAAGESPHGREVDVRCFPLAAPGPGRPGAVLVIEEAGGAARAPAP